MAENKLKSVKISETVHSDMKIFAVQNKVKNLTLFVDEAIKQYIKKLKNR